MNPTFHRLCFLSKSRLSCSKVDQEVGAAIRESGIPRSEIFVTTKFWPHFAHPDTIELCLDKCLKEMGLEYVDLFLAHWPLAMKATSRAGLEKARAGQDVPLEQQGMQKDPETGKEVVDLEYSSRNFGEAVGKQTLLLFLKLVLFTGCIQ